MARREQGPAGLSSCVERYVCKGGERKVGEEEGRKVRGRRKKGGVRRE